MISKTLGAPLGGTTVGGQYGLESLASILIVPPNGAGGFGRYLPSIVVVALGEPGVPVICCAKVEPVVRARTVADKTNARMLGVDFMLASVEMTVVARTSVRGISAGSAETVTSINFSTTGPARGAMQFRRKSRAWRDGQCHRVQCALISQTFCPNFQTTRKEIPIRLTTDRGTPKRSTSCWP